MAQYPQQAGAVPMITQPQVVRIQPDTARPGFAHHSQNRLGILQILCGMLVAVVAVVMIFFESSLFFFGYGIWTGIFFITAGALGVSSAKSKNTCPIVGCLIMCIFCIMAASVVLAFGAIGLAIDSHVCKYSPITDSELCDDEGQQISRKLNITLQAINVLTGLFEWIVALVQMIICCRALCCAPSTPGAVYYQAAPQQVQMQAQYPQQQQQYPAYQYGAQYGAQPYPAAGFAPQHGYPDQRGLQQYPNPGMAQFQPQPQQQAMYPELPPQYDDPNRPPPYNPTVQSPHASAPAPAYGDASYPVKH